MQRGGKTGGGVMWENLAPYQLFLQIGAHRDCAVLISSYNMPCAWVLVLRPIRTADLVADVDDPH